MNGGKEGRKDGKVGKIWIGRTVRKGGKEGRNNGKEGKIWIGRIGRKEGRKEESK